MTVTKTVITLCCLFYLNTDLAHARSSTHTHTIKGVVVTPDGTVVPEFSVVVKSLTDKPQLVPRKHFKLGEFAIGGLAAEKYQLHITAPLFIGIKLVIDLKSIPRDTDYRMVILHPYRNELRLAPGAAYTVTTKVLEEKIPKAASEAYRKGVDLHREGKLQDAMIAYGTAVRNYPRYLEALTDISTIFLLYNQPEAALSFLRRAHEIDTGNTVVNLNIAVALEEQGEYGEARKILTNVLRAEPQMAMAHYFLAKVHYLEKSYDQAESDAQRAVENDPKLLDAWALMINLSLERKRDDQARQALEHIRATIDNQRVSRFIDEQLSTLGS